MSERIRVAVLMGGMSSEHDVSLRSGAGVVGAIDREWYEPVPVVIGRDGTWTIADAAPCSIFDALPRLRDLGIGCVFIALHGPYGEDGRIQGLLDLLDLPYTGSGCAASALAMDKVRCKAVVRAQGIRVAGHVALDRETWAIDSGAVIDAVRTDIGFPCIIKPSRQGSSVGIAIPQSEAEFRAGVEKVLEVDDYIMIEEFVSGTEVTCAVLHAEESGMIRPLPVTEIRPKTAAWFDYEAKYTPGATEEITPAQIPEQTADRVRDTAAYVHDIVGCRGWSRSDFIIDAEGPVWLEVNTVPGLTPTSLFPQAAAAAGISYQRMVSLFIEAARRDHARLKGKP